MTDLRDQIARVLHASWCSDCPDAHDQAIIGWEDKR